MIAKLKNHTIVCGGGLMGQAVIEHLLDDRKPVVLIEKDQEQLEQLREQYPKLLTIHGSATNELTLAEANILEASHVVAAMDSEIDNLLVAITCKDMGHDIEVFARCNDVTIANRMRKAEVDEVISPSRIGGTRIAELILA
jgi:voltage-gated potassium channel